MKLTASYSICYARKKGEIKILTKSSSPHDKPIEKRSYTHARGTKNLALCVCLFLERECKDKWKKKKKSMKRSTEGRGVTLAMWDLIHSERRRKIPTISYFSRFCYLFIRLFYLLYWVPIWLYLCLSLSPPINERETAFFHFLAFEEQWQFWLKISQSTPLFFGFSWFCRRWEMQVKHAYMSCDILSQDIDAHWKKLHEPWKQKKS
jgi:hypothetical protein